MCSDLSEPAEHAKDITQDAFISAFESIGGFTLDGEANQNDHIHLVRGWLGKIANRHFLKLLRSRKKEDDAIQDHRERISSPPELILHENSGVKNTPSNNMFKIKYALSTLSDKQKDVILTYANEGCIGNDKHLSETAMAELCEFHKTNPVNVRKIKNRALKKVISLCPLS
jgi:DNA-directed RNA polymerase specialized sigma24 family protein